MTTRCGSTVHWFDVDMTVRCIRPDGHDGNHRDGVQWWNALGLRVPGAIESAAREDGRGAVGGWKERAGQPRSVSRILHDQTDRRMARTPEVPRLSIAVLDFTDWAFTS